MQNNFATLFPCIHNLIVLERTLVYHAARFSLAFVRKLIEFIFSGTINFEVDRLVRKYDYLLNKQLW